MADGDTGSRALLNRRRALQVSAGAVFSAPTVISLAKTPAYAACASGLMVIDDFSHTQLNSAEISHPSFLFTARGLEHDTYISGDIMNMIYHAANPANYPGLRYVGGMVGNLVGCKELVLRRVRSPTQEPVEAVLTGAAGSGSMIGTEVIVGGGGYPNIIFNLTTINQLILTAPTSLTFAFANPTSNAEIHSHGQLLAR